MKRIVLYNLVYKWKVKPYAFQVLPNCTLKEIELFLKSNKDDILFYRTYPNKVIEVD